MASPILPSVGLGSGINIGSIVTALVDSDKAAKQAQITRQTTTTTAAISGVAQLKSALATYQAALDKLSSSTTPAFLGFAATSSDEKSVKATATNSAVSGTYSIAVGNLATSSKVATAPIDATTASAIPSGKLEITQNGIQFYSVDISKTSTLQEVRDAVNDQLKSQNISANIITDANGSRLVFGSTTTGAGTDISVTGTQGLEFLNVDGSKLMKDTAVGGVPGAGTVSAFALDAKYSVDGLELTSASNTVSGAVSGLSFNLIAQGTSTVTVATNTDGLKASLQTFVDAYNNLVKTVGTLTKRTADADGNLTKPAALTGDSTPNAILAAVKSELSTANGAGGNLTVLSQLGISTEKDGTLSFTAAKFTAALNDKKLGSDIQTLFTGDTGLLARMGNAIKPFTASDGILSTKNTSLTRQQTKLADDQAALDRRVATLTEVLTKKYNAMDLLVGQLKATASNITSMFEAINAQKNAS